MTVQDLMDQVLPRLSGSTPAMGLFDAVRAVQQIIVGRLLMRQSDLVKETLLLDFIGGGSTITLPAEYFAADGLPSVTGKGPVFPLERGMDTTRAVLTLPGDPRYYEVKGRTLTFYPPAAADGEMKFPAFVRPAVPTEMEDDLPFWGAFDHVFAEGVYAVLTAGAAALADAGVAAVIQSQVDQVLAAKDVADEQSLADAINSGN